MTSSNSIWAAFFSRSKRYTSDFRGWKPTSIHAEKPANRVPSAVLSFTAMGMSNVIDVYNHISGLCG